MNNEITTDRQTLFDLVWTYPLVTVAKMFKKSDNGIRKICNANKLPVPKRGELHKIKIGKAVRRFSFNDLPDNVNRKIVIFDWGAGVEKMMDITLPKELPVAYNHAALQPTISEIINLRRQGAEDVSLTAKNFFNIKISASQSMRSIDILNSLASYLSTFNIFFSLDNEELVIKRGNQSMTLSLYETRQRRVKPSNSKKKKLYRNYHDDFEWAGILVLSDATSSYSSMKWKDGKRERLEAKGAKIAFDINEKFDALLQASIEKLERQKAKEIRQLHQVATKQREKQRVRRYEFLKQIFDRSKQITYIEDTRKAISDVFGGHMSKRFRQIDRWLEGEARRIKSQNSLKAICAQLDSNGLFDDIKL